VLAVGVDPGLGQLRRAVRHEGGDVAGAGGTQQRHQLVEQLRFPVVGHVGRFLSATSESVLVTTTTRRTELSTAQRNILTKLGIDAPKKIIELGPAPTTP
jgi:hypothetical protein